MDPYLDNNGRYLDNNGRSRDVERRILKDRAACNGHRPAGHGTKRNLMSTIRRGPPFTLTPIWYTSGCRRSGSRSRASTGTACGHTGGTRAGRASCRSTWHQQPTQARRLRSRAFQFQRGEESRHERPRRSRRCRGIAAEAGLVLSPVATALVAGDATSPTSAVGPRRNIHDAQLDEFERRDLGDDIRTSAATQVVHRRTRPTSIVLDEDLVASLRRKAAKRGIEFTTAE